MVIDRIVYRTRRSPPASLRGRGKKPVSWYATSKPTVVIELTLLSVMRLIGRCRDSLVSYRRMFLRWREVDEGGSEDVWEARNRVRARE